MRSLLLLLLLLPSSLLAQGRANHLSDAEVESVREAAYFPSQRVLVYLKIVDTRMATVRDLAEKKYQAGRIEDLHDTMQQIAGIANEIEDNLEDYDRLHKDLRKSLPKLLDATERWTSVLKQPAQNDSYEVARRLAIEAIEDIRSECKDLITQQQAYFKEHPPAKEDEQKAPVEGIRRRALH